MLGSVSLVNVPTCMVVPGAYAADRYAGRSGAARTLGTPSRGTVSTSVHAPGSPTVIVPVSSVHVTKPSGSARASSERADSAGGCWAAAVAEDPAASTISGRLSAAMTRFVILMSILVVLVVDSGVDVDRGGAVRVGRAGRREGRGADVLDIGQAASAANRGVPFTMVRPAGTWSTMQSPP